MNYQDAELSYNQMAAHSARAEDLVILLLDQLVKDLRLAATVTRSGGIEARAAALKHPTLVLQTLEGLLDPEKGGDLVVWLGRFCASVRARMLEAQIKGSADLLDEQVKVVLEIRGAWQERADRSMRVPAAAVQVQQVGSVYDHGLQDENRGCSWSA